MGTTCGRRSFAVLGSFAVGDHLRYCTSPFPFSLEGARKRFLFCNQSHEIHSIPQVFTGSFTVNFGDQLWSRINCGPFWGSFAVGDHFRYCTELHYRSITDEIGRKRVRLKLLIYKKRVCPVLVLL